MRIKMKPRKAFTLVDVMATLAVLLLGTGGLLGLLENTRRSMAREVEHEIANRILYQLSTQPTAALANYNGKTFDFRGMRDGPPVFRVGVRSRSEGEYAIWSFEVVWESKAGEKRRLASEKYVWEGLQ